MPQTATISAINDVLPSLSLTTTEDVYTISLLANTRSLRSVTFRCDVPWQYARSPGGNYFPMGAGEAWEFDQVNNGYQIYFKTTGGTGTLSAAVSG